MTHRIEETISRGMCIGCGACGVATRGVIPITLNPRGLYQADLTNVPEELVRSGSRVCPFSDESPNEDHLSERFTESSGGRNELIGGYTGVFAGRVADDEYLLGSSSGGLTSWLAARLTEDGVVDAVINVGRPGPSDHEIFGYAEDKDPQARERRKSQYYAATMADVLSLVADSDRRYAIIGVPCFIRAARALCVERPELASRIALFIGLVCGHYKTQAFAESLAWQIGISPGELVDVDFRIKRPRGLASDYDFGAKARNETGWVRCPTNQLVGSNWGHNLFQPEACNFCDDVVGETADVSFGDAWLPQFVTDPRGTSIVICRNSLIQQIFDQAALSGEIDQYPITAEDVARSQAGGFRHRRSGLALRLADDMAAGLSVPRKRVQPDRRSVGPRRRALLRQRREMARISHVAFAEAKASGDLDSYLRTMSRHIRRYRRLDSGLLVRLLRRLRRELMQVPKLWSRGRA